MSKKTIRIGGASGYWGESPMATPQLLSAGELDYIVYDYLAEITMSILARAKAKDPTKGFATDFIDFVLKPNLVTIANSGVKIISNAGGVNPEACAAAARKMIADLGLNLKVGVVTGDNLLGDLDKITENPPTEMFDGGAFPPPDTIASINAYLGAFPVAKALSAGADIVITGRCVDSAVTLGACIHEFGWKQSDWDRLASGSLAGHILECGPQATGGNFTDWRESGDIGDIGYPIAEIDEFGSFELTKPGGTSGLVSVGTVAEQMLYEIGDPQAYLLPDVVCDFSDVTIEQVNENRVRISQARGHPAPDTYKTCATYADGFRTGITIGFYGIEAAQKAQAFSEAVFKRARRTLKMLNAPEFTETSVEILGAGSQFGEDPAQSDAREVFLKVAAKHKTPLEGGVLLKELSGLGLATAPGLSGFQGSRAKPSPMVRLFSYLTPKTDIDIRIEIEGELVEHKDEPGLSFDTASIIRPTPPEPTDPAAVSVPLIKLAFARSGDKGDKANIGVIARQPAYLPYIWSALSEETIVRALGHFIDGAPVVQRFYLPGINAMNILIDNVLGGGGVASLRHDPQGKGYSQILLSQPVQVPSTIAHSLNELH